MKRKSSGCPLFLSTALIVIGVIFLTMHLVGCMWVKDNIDNLKDTLLYAQTVYIEQYDLYLEQFEVCKDADCQKVLKVKREILMEMEPKIKALKKCVDTETIPLDDLEAEIIRLINRLSEVK